MRFLLSPLEESMSARQTRSQGSDARRVYAPTEPPIQEAFHFGCSSGWGREHLCRLGVLFESAPEQRDNDLAKTMGWTQSGWPDQLTERLAHEVPSNSLGVSNAARELEDFQIGQIQCGAVDLDDFADGYFYRTFAALLVVTQEQDKKQRDKGECLAKKSKMESAELSVSTSIIRKRSAEPSSTKPKRFKTANAPAIRRPKTPPDQLTIPANPNISGRSTESKDEENTKLLLSEFMLDIMRVIRDVRKLKWVRSACPVELTKTSFSFVVH